MTDDEKALVERLQSLHVWPQIVADYHAAVLTPRQIDKLYEVGRVSHDAADRIEALSAENERLREQLSGISGRLEAMRVALIHTAGICNPLSGFLKNVTGLRKKHLDSVQAIARAALGEQQ